MTRIGYVRVGQYDDDLDLQTARLKAFACSAIHSEAEWKAKRATPNKLDRIIRSLELGDELVVLRLDCVGRSAREVIKLVRELAVRGAALHVLEPGITTAGSVGETVIAVLDMIAELELKVITERKRDGIEAGKIAGSYKGRLKSVDDDEIRKRVAAGESKASIARAMKISRMTIYRALQQSPR